MLMMLAGRSENRRRDYADDFRFLRHLPCKSMTMMLMMLVLFVRDHLCKALVRLAASYPRALFIRADDAAFLDRLPAKSGQHGTIMHPGRQLPQASTIDIAQWFEVACFILVILFWTKGVSKRQHHQHRVQNKITMKWMMLVFLDATSNSEAISMVLACGHCLLKRSCAMLAAWDIRRQAVQKTSIASTFAECCWIGRRASALQQWPHTTSTSIVSWNVAKSENLQKSRFLGSASSASSLLVCR